MLDVPRIGCGWHPVGAGDADEEGHETRDYGTGEGCKFEEETHAVLEGAGVRRGKLVGGGGEGGMEEVAVGGVDFDCLSNGVRKKERMGGKLTSKPAFRAR